MIRRGTLVDAISGLSHVTVHGVNWEHAAGDWSCHVRGSLGPGGGGTARPDMLAVHTPAREANRSKPYVRQVAPTVSMAPANRAPNDGRPHGTFGHDVGGLDPGDIQTGPEGRPQEVDAFAHPSHPEITRPDDLGQELAEPGLHPACPELSGPQGRPVHNEGGPVGDEGPDQAPGPHPHAGAVVTTGDETLDVPGEVCPAQQSQLRRVQPAGAYVAVAGDHAMVVRPGHLPDHQATAPR